MPHDGASVAGRAGAPPCSSGQGPGAQSDQRLETEFPAAPSSPMSPRQQQEQQHHQQNPNQQQETAAGRRPSSAPAASAASTAGASPRDGPGLPAPPHHPHRPPPPRISFATPATPATPHAEAATAPSTDEEGPIPPTPALHGTPTSGSPREPWLDEAWLAELGSDASELTLPLRTRINNALHASLVRLRGRILICTVLLALFGVLMYVGIVFRDEATIYKASLAAWAVLMCVMLLLVPVTLLLGWLVVAVAYLTVCRTKEAKRYQLFLYNLHSGLSYALWAVGAFAAWFVVFKHFNPWPARSASGQELRISDSADWIPRLLGVNIILGLLLIGKSVILTHVNLKRRFEGHEEKLRECGRDAFVLRHLSDSIKRDVFDRNWSLTSAPPGAAMGGLAGARSARLRASQHHAESLGSDKPDKRSRRAPAGTEKPLAYEPPDANAWASSAALSLSLTRNAVGGEGLGDETVKRAGAGSGRRWGGLRGGAGGAQGKWSRSSEDLPQAVEAESREASGGSSPVSPPSGRPFKNRHLRSASLELVQGSLERGEIGKEDLVPPPLPRPQHDSSKSAGDGSGGGGGGGETTSVTGGSGEGGDGEDDGTSSSLVYLLTQAEDVRLFWLRVCRKSKNIKKVVEAERLGEAIFWRFRSRRAPQYIFTSQLRRMVSSDRRVANEVCDWLDPRGNGQVTLSEVRELCVAAFRRRKYLYLTLADTAGLIASLSTFLNAGVLLLVFVATLLVYSTAEYAEVTVALGSSLFAFSFIFAGAANNIFVSFVFLFGRRAFEIGDVVRIYERDYEQPPPVIVQKLTLGNTIFKHWDGEVFTIPNHVLYNRKVGNWTVSGPQTDHFFLSIPWKTPLEKIQGLEKVFKDFLQANSDTMQPDTSFMFVRELVEQNRLLVYFYMQHTDNFRNWIHLPKRQALLLLLKAYCEKEDLVLLENALPVHVVHGGAGGSNVAGLRPHGNSPGDMAPPPADIGVAEPPPPIVVNSAML